MKTSIETIAIGDELLTGKTADTNSAFVADELFKKGLRMDRSTVIADDFEVMAQTIQERARKAGVIVCFGGLGPTSDDKTAECVARLLKGKLLEHSSSKERLLKYYAERNRPITSQSLKQILYPEGSIPLPNSKGMAPGFHCEIEGCQLFFLPGVPYEMKGMFVEHVLPSIQKHLAPELGSTEILSHVWRCLGIWESELQRVMDPIEAALPSNAYLGYRTRPPENHLTLYWKPQNDQSSKDFESWKPKIREILTQWTFTEDNRDLEVVVGDALQKRKWKVALAESCTGGLAIQRLTRVAGASDWVWGGYVTYEIEAKSKMLGVRLDEWEQAVSAECSESLARAALESSGCELAAAVTGYVGPTGGTEKNPLGTLYISVVVSKAAQQQGARPLSERLVIPVRTREDAQWSASSYLLNLIRQSIEN